MAEPNTAAEKKSLWRILKYVLPVLFLAAGFFGVQIWMVLDEKNAEKPDTPITAEMKAPAIKADIAKISASAGTATPETPVTVVKPPAGSEQASASQIPELVYYRLQAGSFDDPQGADKFRKKLSEMGYGAMVIKAGAQSKVIVMAFFSREQAETVQGAMEAKGVSGYPEKITVPSQMVLLQSGSQRLQTFMDGSLVEIPEMLRELCDYYYIYENQGMDVEAQSTLILKQIGQISDMKTAIENMQVAPEDQMLQVRIKDYLTGYLQYLEKAKKSRVMDRKSLWPGLLNCVDGFERIGIKD